MKVFLMYEERDFDLGAALPLNGRDLVDDLELNTLIAAMAGEDEFLQTVARTALLTATRSETQTIAHRQMVCRDALANIETVRQLYQLSIDALEIRKKNYWGTGLHYPLGILHGSMDVIAALVPKLIELRDIARSVSARFSSPGWRRLYETLDQELDEGYIEQIQNHLKELKFRRGILVSAHLGQGNRGNDYTLRTPNIDQRNWLARAVSRRPESYKYTLAPRDETGARCLSELADRGVNPIANAVAQSAEHIASFFTLLRAELAFYICCINLHEHLSRLGGPICFPDFPEQGQQRQNFTDLYDACLALKLKRGVVSNSIEIGDSRLVVITGANQGGKSSFLRGLGVAQLMMQSGMFVCASAFSANLADGIYTHYKREEDTTMESGKFDEELKRMSSIVDQISPNALILFNESFASTNEREGSDVAQMITHALLDKGIKVFFVTHQYTLAHGLFAEPVEQALYLRAERKPDGARTFRLTPGEPQETSYGTDLYEEIFCKRTGRHHEALHMR
jgi:hypothetical protein